jgi:hypothetical protein
MAKAAATPANHHGGRDHRVDPNALGPDGRRKPAREEEKLHQIGEKMIQAGS